jgi:hypothetical protein
MTEEWKKLNGEELHNLNCSVLIIMLIKLRRMRLSWYAVNMGEQRKWVEN